MAERSRAAVAVEVHDVVRLPIAVRRRRSLGVLVVVAAAAVPYLNTLLGGFVFDDHELVAANPMATPGMSAWAWLLRPSTAGSLYRPVTMLSYAIDGALGGTTVGFHATNVLLHVAASVAAFALAAALLPRRRDALAAATLFAVHPVHTEAVANLAGRAEVLAGLFALTAVAAAVRAVDDTRPARWLVLAFATTMLGVFSKESAVTLPLLFGVALWWRGARPNPGRMLVVALVVVAACAPYVVARYAVVGTLGLRVPPPYVDNPLAYVAAQSRVATAIVVIGDYFGVLTLPLRLSADDTFDQVPVVSSAGDPRLLAAIAGLALVGVLAFRSRRTVPAVWFGLVFGVAALAVTSNLVFPIGTIKAERFLYLPAFGWCVAAAGLAAAASHRVDTRALALVVLAFAVRTGVRNADWRDDYRLFTATAVTSPNSARAQSNAGAVHAQRGELDEAAFHFETAARIRPTFVPAEIGLGRVRAMQGRPVEALAAFDAARHGDTPSPEASLRAGDLRLDMGDAGAAEQTYRDGLAAAPANPELLLGLALADATLGRRDEAIAIRDALFRDGPTPSGGAMAARMAALTAALGDRP